MKETICVHDMKRGLSRRAIQSSGKTMPQNGSRPLELGTIAVKRREIPDHLTDNTNMDKPTEEQLSRLPKWAQDHIKTIERERFVAIREMNQWLDSQTKSPISIQENVCTGEECGPSLKTRYVQGYCVRFEWAGIDLTVTVPTYAPERKEIVLQWGGLDRIGNEVAMIPTSFQTVRLVAKENMR